ncbi:reverse transcriptase domain-containing protein [Clostridium sp. WILCCON 0269]|uniref:Reverse transcriptase domain-containing protein n=1 Tax=Candidatus Clostridium eludens TaxID=3381663 RepID=A0ABW8SPB8_9CLOT
MQKAELVLAILKDKSEKNPNYKFERVYRYLFNVEFYLMAYSKLCNENKRIHSIIKGRMYDFNIENVHKVVEELKSETYYPESLKILNTHILKKNKKCLQTINLYDNLIQQIIKEILESIYDVNFSSSSHGFRPGRSCHTALYQIKNTCGGANWVIKGNIQKVFYNIDHDFIIKLLSEKICDGRFIELINRFFMAGYMCEKKTYETWSGILKRETIGNMLLNIYLDKFDKYVNKNFGQVKHIRYLDNFIIFVWGTKDLAEDVRKNINGFLKEKLKIEIAEEELLMVSLNDKRIKFLGYEIAKSTQNFKIQKFTGLKEKKNNQIIQLLVPSKVIKERIKPFISNGKSVHNNFRINLPIWEIISQYNKEIIELYNYYCLAADVSVKVGRFKFYHYFSLAKTLARKEKISVKQVIDKYGIEFPRKSGDGTKKIIGIKYNTKNGIEVITYFNGLLKKKNKPIADLNDMIWN